jgi:hypothetical protein
MSPQIPPIDHHQQTLPEMQQQQQKTVQWGDDSIFPYEPSPSASLASSQQIPTISPMSPPQQASTPLQTSEEGGRNKPEILGMNAPNGEGVEY